MKQRNQLLYQVKKYRIYRALLVFVVISVCWNNHNLAQDCPYLVASEVPVCEGYPVTITIEDLPDNAIIVGWQTSNSVSFNNILSDLEHQGSSQSITFENGFQDNIYVKANILLNGFSLIDILGCSDPWMGVSVEHPVSTNEISSSTYTIDCETELPIQLTGVQNSTASTANNYIWQKSTDQNSWQPMGTGANIDIIQLPNESIYVRRIITQFSCEPHTSNVIFLEVESDTDPGTISGSGSYCATETPTPLTLTDYEGDILKWEKSQNSINYTVINGSAGSETIIPDATTGTTYYRALVQKGGCAPEYSPVDSVTIYPEMVNIIDAIDQEVCADEIPEPINGNNPETVVSDGTSVLWLSKQFGDESWGNYPEGAIVNDSGLVFTQPLTETTIITRVVSWGVGADCSSFSDSVVVYVSPQTEAGQFADDDNQQSLCSGEEANIIVLEDFTGEIIDWYSSTSPVGPWESLGVNSFEFSPGQISEDTYFRVKVQSGVCQEASSDVYSIEVTPPSDAGNFTDTDNSQNLCPGSIPDQIVLENYSGEILNWYSTSDTLDTWTALNHTSPEYQPEVLNQDTYYKVEIQSGSCEPVFSDIYSVEYYDPISNNTIYSDTTLCEGETAPMLTGDFPTGSTETHTLLWQQWTTSSGWVDAIGDNNDQDYSPGLLEETTHFRRIVSGDCPSDTSNTIVVEIVEQPSGSLSGGGYYCPGEDGTEIFVHLEGTPPFDFSLFDGQDTTTVYDIDTNDHIVTVTADSITTYTLISVSNAYCGVDGSMATSSVQINPLPAIGEVSAGLDTAVCSLIYDLSGSELIDESHSCTWTDESGNVLSNEPEFTFTADSPGEYEFIYTVSSDSCNTAASDTILVTLDKFEPANAGDDQQICSDTTLMAAQPVDVEYWSGHWMEGYNIDPDDPFDPATTMRYLEHGNTYEIAWITEPVLSASACDADTSWLTITVDPLSDAGTLSANDLQLCEGDLASLELTDFTGDVTKWLFQDNDGLEVVPENFNTFESDDFNSDTGVSVVVTSGTCAPDTTDILTLEVSPPTNPGVLGSDQQVCEGENSGTMEMTGFEGDILFWEFSNNNFETSNILESDQASYDFENLNATTQFRTKVQSGFCDAVFSNTATVEVLPTISADFELQEAYCSSDSEIDLSSLIETGATGTWEINGEVQPIFDPALYAGSEVAITYSNDQTACFESSTQQTVVDENPVVEITAAPEICGLDTEISVNSSVGTGSWEVDDAIVLGGSSSDQSLDIVALEYGSYELTWLAQNGACVNSSSHQINFNESPSEADAGERQVLDFTYDADLEANQPEVGTGTWSSTNPKHVFTDVNNPTATVRNLEVGENKLIWTIANGNCPASVSEVVVDVKGLIVPNAFSPNGDNVNDRYVIRGLEAIGPVELKVWNRWGKTVYQSSDYQNDWTGLHQNGNELRSDTYYYLIKAKSLDEIFKGFIVLQR